MLISLRLGYVARHRSILEDGGEVGETETVDRTKADSIKLLILDSRQSYRAYGKELHIISGGKTEIF